MYIMQCMYKININCTYINNTFFKINLTQKYTVISPEIDINAYFLDKVTDQIRKKRSHHL